MASALVKKSVTDLTRRKGRTIFTVLTLAIAVASVGIFAIPSLMDRAMQKEVQANRLPDVTLSMKPLHLTPNQLAGLGRLPNVTAAEGRSYFQTRVWVGDRRVKAAIIAAPAYGHQTVDVVSLTSGAFPDGQQRSQRRPERKAGTLLRQGRKHDPHPRRRRPSREGSRERCRAQHDRRSGSGRDGIRGSLLDACAARETRRGPGLQQPRASSPRHEQGGRRAHRRRRAQYLTANTAFTGFSDLPQIREPGTYPFQDFFEQLASIMNVFTLLALLAGLVLIANTMTALIGEQRREIGVMKAIGGTRRQIRGVYLRTALLLGAAGSVIGVVLGVLVANAVVRFFGNFFAISPGFEISVPVVVASVLVGLLAPPLAALPAIRRGSRIPVREGLEEVPALQGGQAVVDRLLRRLQFLPRTAQIGIRSVTRRGRRTRHDRRADRPCRRDAARRARAHRHRHQDDQRRSGTSPASTSSSTRPSAPSSTRAPPG